MASICGDPAGPDGVSLKVEDRYMTDQLRRLERRASIQTCITIFLVVLCIILIAIVAWLGVSVRSLNNDLNNVKTAGPGGINVQVTNAISMINQLNTSTLSNDPKSLASQVQMLNNTIMPTPVYFTKGKPAVPGFTSFGSLARGSGTWAVQPTPTPWGALSDHLVLSNETNLLYNGTNSMVILGGMDDKSIFSKKMYSYDGMFEVYTAMPDMPVPRTRFAGAIGNGKIYVTGGYAGPTALNDFDASLNSSVVQDNTLDVFDFSTNRWSRSVSSAFIRRSDHCGMWANNKLYIVGGYDPTYAILNTTEVYDPVARTVTVVPSMALPEPRGDVGCNAVGSVLFVHGGYYDPSGNFGGNSHKNTTWAFDLSNPSAGWVRKADMNWPRGDHAFAVLSGGRLLVMGGENDPVTTNDKTPIRSVEMYNIADDVWSEKAPLAFARFRFSAGVVSSYTTGDSTVYAFGGHQLCLNTGSVYSADPPITSLAMYQNATSCASKAANTLSVYSNLQHPDIFVYLQNGVAAGAA